MYGAGRATGGNGDYKTGQAVGDFVASVVGTGEALIGGGEALVTAPAAVTIVGAALPVAGAAVAVQGATTAAIAGSHLAAAAFSSSLEDASASTTTDKPHGNTAGDQPAELYEKYDKNGNFEKHGVSQDANKRYSKSEINGGEVRVVDRGPRKEMLQKERQRVETDPGPKNREPWAGKQKEQE
jgi:hypothetical protein